jgi:16S rRNA (guanine966-N2)-methyltransferase
MSIKILGGEAKGVTLASPSSFSTRPTSVLLKRRLFDAFQDMNSMTFIDLCAGVGGIGLEALSRGASKVMLIENNPKTFSILKKNKQLVVSKLEGAQVEIIKMDAFKWLAIFKEEYFTWDKDQQQNCILFFDPPYEMKEMYQNFQSVTEWFQGRIMVEACRQKTMHEDELQKLLFDAVKTYRQGTSYIIVGDFR